MHFKNKKTGVTWHITNESHQKRLQASDDYVELSGTNTHDVSLEAHSKPVNDPSNKTDNSDNMQVTDEAEQEETTSNKVSNKIKIEMMGWQELRQFASKSGLNIKNMKRKQIESELLDKLGEYDEQ